MSGSGGEEFIGNALGALSRAIVDQVDRALLDATGLSHSASCAIVQIGSSPNMSIEALRRALNLDHSTVVRMLDRLEVVGIVNRTRGTADDLRKVALVLTDEGWLCHERITLARQKVLSNALVGLEASERDRFLQLVYKMMPYIIANSENPKSACRLCNDSVCNSEDCPVNMDPPDRHTLVLSKSVPARKRASSGATREATGASSKTGQSAQRRVQNGK